MTTRDLFAKHYGSLTIALFGVVLLGVIAAFGGEIGALTSRPAAEPVAAEPGVPAPENQQAAANSESPPAPDEGASSTQNASEQAPVDEAAQKEKEEEERRAELSAGVDASGVDPTPENVSPPDPSAQQEQAPAPAE